MPDVYQLTRVTDNEIMQINLILPIKYKPSLAI